LTNHEVAAITARRLPAAWRSTHAAVVHWRRARSL